MEIAREEQSVKVGYGQILKQKSYLLYIIAGLVSRFGDSIDSIAYSWMVYELTGSTALMATLFGFNAIPNIIFQPIAGVYVDYRSKKKIQIICNLGRGTVVFLTAAMFLTGTLKVYHLFIFTFINSTFEAFEIPSGMAMLPLILDKEHFAYGKAFSSTASRIVELIGLAAAGGIIAWIGISGALVIDALTFSICALLITMLRPKKEELTKQPIRIKNYTNDLIEGFKYIYGHKVVFNLAVFCAMLNVILAPYNALSVAYIRDVLGLGPEFMSAMGIAMTVGMIVGGVIYPKINEKVKGIHLFIGSGIIIGLWYMVLIGVSFIANISLIYIISGSIEFLSGLSFSIIMMQVQVAFMKKVEPAYLGRAAGVMNAMGMSAMPLSAFIIGGISLVVNIQTLFVVSGILVIILFGAQKFNKHLQEI